MAATDAGEEQVMDAESVVNVEKFLCNPVGVHSLQSLPPPRCLREDCFMGIDEAGRGPVLGI